jgi:hypothetical protein
MTGQSPEPRSQTAYASLRAASDAATASQSAPAAAAPAAPKSESSYWRQEADKLDVLLQTMWTGFLDAETNGLPTALADYVAAYTSATRLRLTLMGYASMPHRGFKATAQPGPRTKQP